MERYLCIHGHFYQPPRENPWLEAIELQDSAYPYHDWNERITAECYAPNATARRLDGDGRIVDIVNNYSRISFNFGPTLLAWMQEHAADVLAAVVEAGQAEPGEVLGAWLGLGSSLQPHDPAAGELPRQRDPGGLGASAISSTASAGRPRACGLPRPPPIRPPSRCSPGTASSSPFSLRSRPAGCAR